MGDPYLSVLPTDDEFIKSLTAVPIKPGDPV
jgi:hypothetical protein